MDLTNLFSGIFGAILGAAIGSITTIFIYWYGQHKASRRKLLDKLLLLKDDVWWNCKVNTTQSTKIWNNSLNDILIFYNTVYDWSLPCQRIRLKKAWKKYKGEIKGTKDETLTKSQPKDKEDFIHKINTLIDSL